jgi:CTP:molybdopterin cytidylyltransferase MocA
MGLKLKKTEITALVLAAGHSSRMGDLKPLLKIGAKTVLERVISIFPEAGITDVRVIVGYRHSELLPQIEECGATWIKNDQWEQGMFSSVKAGVATIEDPSKGFLLLPVDIPMVEASTINKLVDVFDQSRKLVCYPTFLGKRGHPPVISAQYRNEILQWANPGGLGGFLRQKQADSIDVDVEDEGILLDIDAPEDYRNLLERLGLKVIESSGN